MIGSPRFWSTVSCIGMRYTTSSVHNLIYLIVEYTPVLIWTEFFHFNWSWLSLIRTNPIILYRTTVVHLRMLEIFPWDILRIGSSIVSALSYFWGLENTCSGSDISLEIISKSFISLNWWIAKIVLSYRNEINEINSLKFFFLMVSSLVVGWEPFSSEHIKIEILVDP